MVHIIWWHGHTVCHHFNSIRDIEIQHTQSLCFVLGLFHIELYGQQSMYFITS